MSAWVGLGANLGDARENVLDALERLAWTRGVQLLRASSLYRTAPIDSSGDDYVNAVAEVATSLSARALLAALHEHRAGPRPRTALPQCPAHARPRPAAVSATRS